MHLLVGGLAGVANLFLASEHWKKFEIFEMHSNLGHGAEMLSRHK